MTQHIRDFCEDKARAGDSRYAVAYAILELAQQHAKVARALDTIGLNNMNPEGPPGALEEIGMQMKALVEAISASTRDG